MNGFGFWVTLSPQQHPIESTSSTKAHLPKICGSQAFERLVAWRDAWILSDAWYIETLL